MLKYALLMPKYTDPGFERLKGAKSVAAEMWNAQNGVMISYGVNNAARVAFQLASRVKNTNGSISYIAAHEGSTKWLHKARRESVGLNAAALGLIHALNMWDDRSREVVTVVNPLQAPRRTMREWRGELRFNELGLRERSGLAAPFATEPFVLTPPNREPMLAEELSVIVRQGAAGNLRTQTVLNFNGGEATYGIEANGLIVPGKPLGPEQAVSTLNQAEAALCFGGMLTHLTRTVVAEIARP